MDKPGEILTDLPDTCVLDTSVLIKWFRQKEILADQAIALRNAFLDGRLLIALPSLAAYELANVLRYKLELTTAHVQNAVQSLFDMDMRWIEPSIVLLNRAVEIARHYEVSVYDAIFVSLAESEDGISITADERLARKLSELPSIWFLGALKPS